MGESTDWEDRAYTYIFEEEIRGLKRRKAHDPSLTVDELKGILDSLYTSEGNNYEGRGPVGDITIAATIAAYERFIIDWEAANKSAENGSKAD